MAFPKKLTPDLAIQKSLPGPFAFFFTQSMCETYASQVKFGESFPQILGVNIKE